MPLSQLPPSAPLEVVAGNPFPLTIACTGATITAGAIDLMSAPGVASTVTPPTPTTNSNTITVPFSVADTIAMQALTGPSSKKVMAFSVSGLVNGVGPYELVAGTFTVHPVGTTGVATASTANLSVTVGGVAVSLAVSVGGAANAAGLAFTPAAGIAATNVQAAIQELVADVASQYSRRRMFDVRDYLSSDDIGAAINRAIRAAKLDEYSYGKPGQVVIPPGSWAQTTEIDWFLVDGTTPAHGVDLIGSGWGKTILRPQGTIACIKHLSATGSSALNNVLIADFEIDGSEQSGTYSTGIKGIYLSMIRRVQMEHLYVHDTGATGVGTDHHEACVIRDVVADGCGRLNNGSQGGGAGIGIGTGTWSSESLDISACVTRNNIRNGIFFETQSGAFPLGIRLTGHLSEFNGGHGVEDAGCRGLIVTGLTSRKNTLAGFALGQGTISPGAPGIDGSVNGADLSENTTDGIWIDYSGRYAGNGTGASAIAGGFTAYEQSGSQSTYLVEQLNYSFANVTCRDNGRDGIRIDLGAQDLRGLRFASTVRALENDECGLKVTSTGAGGRLMDSTIDIVAQGNGRDTGATNRAGVRIGANTARVSIGAVANDGQSSKTQTYGVQLAEGTIHSALFVAGSDVRQNLTASTDLSGVTADVSVFDANAGYPATPTLAQRYDTFAKTDNASSLGSTQGGTDAATAWSIFDSGSGGGWGITSNAARIKVGGTGNVTAYQDVGVVAGTHRVTLKTLSGSNHSGGLAFRCSDAANYFFVSLKASGGTMRYCIEKRIAGSRSEVGTNTGTAPASGDVIRCVDTGTVITVYVNGTQVATGTDSALNTITRCGLVGNDTQENTTRYTDWSFTP